MFIRCEHDGHSKGMLGLGKAITIRVESDLHRGIKVRITKEDITLETYILDLVKRDLGHK